MKSDFETNSNPGRLFLNYRQYNASVLHTQCVQILRKFYGREHLTDQEYELCDELGYELAETLPQDFKMNRLVTLTPDQILEWAQEQQLDDIRLAEEEKAMRFTRGEKWIALGFIFGIITFILLWHFL